MPGVSRVALPGSLDAREEALRCGAGVPKHHEVPSAEVREEFKTPPRGIAVVFFDFVQPPVRCRARGLITLISCAPALRRFAWLRMASHGFASLCIALHRFEDGTLTATPGDRAARRTKQVELCARVRAAPPGSCCLEAFAPLWFLRKL